MADSFDRAFDNAFDKAMDNAFDAKFDKQFDLFLFAHFLNSYTVNLFFAF